MTRRHSTLLALLASALLGAVAFFLLSGGDDLGAPLGEPVAQAGGGEPGPSLPVETAVGEVAPAVEPRIAGQREPRAIEPGADSPTSGVLDIRIQLTAKAATRFAGGTLSVLELLNENVTELRPERGPWSRSMAIKATPGESPVYAECSGVPFSPYGYRVELFVPGMNGSEQVVRVGADSWNPQVDLSVTTGSPLSVRVIDQQRDPYTERDVVLVPIERPLGRPMVQQKTDNFGTAVFEEVLAGDYELRLDGQTAQTITVQRPGFVRDDLNVGVQSALIVVARGPTLKVEVFDVIGWALEGVDVRVMAIDTTLNRRYEDRTDRNGVCEFPSVIPGRYQVDVTGRGYQQTSRTVMVEDGKDPPPVQLRMARLH